LRGAISLTSIDCIDSKRIDFDESLFFGARVGVFGSMDASRKLRQEFLAFLLFGVSN
jgi:hypothetical protein